MTAKPTINGAEDDNLVAAEVAAERVRVFADRMYVGALAKPVGTLTIAWMGWTAVGPDRVAVWLCLISLIEIALVWLASRHRRQRAASAAVPGLANAFTVLTGLAGLAWGVSVFFFWVDGQFVGFLLNVTVLVGVAGIALVIMSPLPNALALFYLGLLLPPVLRHISAGAPYTVEVVGGLSMLSGLLAYFGRVAERELVSNLEATARNAILTGRLAGARDELTVHQRDLQAKNEALTDALARLHEGEARLRLAFDAARQGWFDVNLRTGEILVSPEYARLLGFEPDVFHSDMTTWFANIHEDDLPGVRRIFFDSLAGDETVEAVYRRRTKAGDWRWISSIGRVVERDANGTPLRVTGIHTDITERKRAEGELTASKERFERAAETVPVVLYDYRHNGDGTKRFLYVSRRCREVFGVDAETLMADAACFWNLVHPADFMRVQKESTAANRSGSPFKSEFRIITPNGEQKWIHVESNPIATVAGVRSGFALDVTEQKLLEEELRMMATTDFLTGLATRRSFIVRLEDELARLHRTGDQSTALLMLDLDHFKRINDTFGHATGDALLKHFSATVSNELRRIDLAGRLGGEEFGIILPGAEAAAALAFAERLRLRIAESPLLGYGAPMSFTVSIGVTHLRASDRDPDVPLARADQALYRAKQSGRNCVEVAAGGA